MKRILFVLCLLIAFGNAFATPSKKELYSRARDALKQALETKDFERSRQAIEYLKINRDEGAPFWEFEEYLSLMEIGDYDEGVAVYSDIRRFVLDSAYNPVIKPRVKPDNDALHLYLYRDLAPFTKAKADSMVALVENSNAKKENKELYATLVYAELVVALRTYRFERNRGFTFRVIEDTTAANDFLTHAKRYIENYSHTDHAQYLKEQVVPFVESFMEEQREFRRDPIAHKYYTGGFGFYAGSWLGFLSGEISDFAKSEMGTPVQFEAELRVRRISLAAFLRFGMIVKKKPNENDKYNYDLYDEDTVDESMGLTLGYTVYDSHYLRVEPFMGVGVTYMPSLQDPQWDEYSVGPQWILGTNVDFRFYAVKPSRIGALSTAWILRFKYKIMLGTAESGVTNGDKRAPSYGAIHHEFGLSLGFNLW